MLVLSSEQLMR